MSGSVGFFSSILWLILLRWDNRFLVYCLMSPVSELQWSLLTLFVGEVSSMEKELCQSLFCISTAVYEEIRMNTINTWLLTCFYIFQGTIDFTYSYICWVFEDIPLSIFLEVPVILFYVSCVSAILGTSGCSNYGRCNIIKQYFIISSFRCIGLMHQRPYFPAHFFLILEFASFHFWDLAVCILYSIAYDIL